MHFSIQFFCIVFSLTNEDIPTYIHTYIHTYIYHAKSRLNIPVRGLLRSPNNSNNQFNIIQARIDFFKVPPDLGRIPNKIHSGFASFTAEQWKNWTVNFSVASMHDILDKAVLECWRHFVLACRILLMNTISVSSIKLGDALLLQSAKEQKHYFENQLSLPICICTVTSGSAWKIMVPFWCFSERYNGVLGSMPNNNKAIEDKSS